jgi:uncharacterized protein (DUF58 family)
MSEFSFNDVLSAITHIRGGMPVERLTNRIRLGEHRSRYFGAGDFFDIQEYDPDRDPPSAIINGLGDDEIIYARRCIEPHEVKINFMVDLSSSMDVGAYLLKRRILLEALGFIGATGIRYQDPVGIIGFTDKIVLNFTPKCGANNFYYLLKETYEYLVRTGPDTKKYQQRKTDFFAALDFINRNFNRACFIPFISDFVGFEKVLKSPLLRMVSAKHELMFIFLDDPGEILSQAGFGYLRVEDIEGGKPRIISRRKSSLVEYEKELRYKRKLLRRKLLSMGIYSVVLEPGKHFKRLYRFFQARQKARPNRR